MGLVSPRGELTPEHNKNYLNRVVGEDRYEIDASDDKDGEVMHDYLPRKALSQL